VTRTYSPRLAEIERNWYVVDAEGATLGRLAAAVASVLRGKHKPTWTPHLDTGDFVIVINAEKAVLSGKKDEQKVYYRVTGAPGGLKQETAGKLRARRPTKLIEDAVKGMLPKNSLGRKQWKKLKVYAGAEHPHAAQKPESLAVGTTPGAAAA
jgi:large subunit ribosomal protein L13